jgi:small subunit ribosomal protein S19
VEKKKELTFKGKTIEELKQLEVREFAKYLRSRDRRTLLRQFQDIENFIGMMNEKTSKNKSIRTHKRYVVITPQFVGKKVFVYNGKIFVPVEITIEMLGHRLGEFAVTRTKVKHGTAGIGASKGTKHKSKK